MICYSCNSPVAPGVNFCPRCGASIVRSSPPPPAWMPLTGPPMALAGQGRVARHLHTLGILWCVYTGYRILTLLFGLSIMGAILHSGMWGDDWGGFHPSWFAPMIPVIGFFAVLWAGVALFTGYSLLTHRPWGRTLAIILSIPTLLKLPLGTALGIYTLWVLAPQDSGFAYDALASRQLLAKP